MKAHFIAPYILIALFSLSCEGPQGPQGPSGAPGTGGIGDLTDPRIQPSVLYTYPPANSQGPYIETRPTQIQLRFNKIMDVATLRRAIKVVSNRSPVYADTANLQVLGGDVVIFNVIDSARSSYYNVWGVGATYGLTVSSLAKDVNGNSLLPGFAMSFLPEPYFRVKQVLPVNGAQNVQSTNWIHLEFNSKVDTSILSHLSITPPPQQGQWRLDSDSLYMYFSTNGLNTNTNYQLSLTSAAHDKHGNFLNQPFLSSFRTGGFEVTYTLPANGGSSTALYSDIHVSFSTPLDTSSIRSAVRSIPFLDASFSYYFDSPSFNLYPRFGFLADTTYYITIDTSLRTRYGVHLALPYVLSFHTDPFRVTSTQPYDGQQNVPRNLYSFAVYLNGRVDTGTVRTAITTTGLSGYTDAYDNTIYFNITERPLPANKTFTVSILTSLRTASGSQLKSPFSFSFTTGNF